MMPMDPVPSGIHDRPIILGRCCRGGSDRRTRGFFQLWCVGSPRRQRLVEFNSLTISIVNRAAPYRFPQFAGRGEGQTGVPVNVCGVHCGVSNNRDSVAKGTSWNSSTGASTPMRPAGSDAWRQPQGSGPCRATRSARSSAGCVFPMLERRCSCASCWGAEAKDSIWLSSRNR